MPAFVMEKPSPLSVIAERPTPPAELLMMIEDASVSVPLMPPLPVPLVIGPADATPVPLTVTLRGVV